MTSNLSKFIFFALAPTGEGISGSDRIFIELAREWSKTCQVCVYTTIEGIQMARRQKLNGKYLKLISVSDNLSNLFLVKYIQKILLGLKLGFRLKIRNTEKTFLYSASDFWMDFFPAMICKIRHPHCKLVCTWYQTAPNPLKGYKEDKRPGSSHRLRSFLYWFMQFPVKPLIKKYADKIIVNNENEKNQFPLQTRKGKVVVLIGGVPLEDIKKYLSENEKLLQRKVYDAVFQGRFHPQKGVVELIDIWAKVVEKVPNAKLAMIGDGPLMEKVKQKIKANKLEKNVRLFGYLFDGPKKYEILSQSKVVVHPAFYDSGGMASAEAMAFGIPCVGFDLVAYKSYYPKGMVKVKIGDLQSYADNIVRLLKDDKLRRSLGDEAYAMISKNWSWDVRANNLLRAIKN
ncbi:MAG: glycosyltransferase family 4 protein [Patescibacteria group bacterium]|nr:glycosyltransferase family 4 protein [Patescibacteria group bacterium]